MKLHIRNKNIKGSVDEYWGVFMTLSLRKSKDISVVTLDYKDEKSRKIL